MIKKMLWSVILVNHWCYDSIIYQIHIYNYYEHWFLKWWRNVIRKQFKKLKSLLNLIRVTKPRGRNIEPRKKPLWSIQTRKLNKFWSNLRKKKKIKNFIYHTKSFRKTARNKLMLGWGLRFELTTCDLWFNSQIQSFTNKYFPRNKKVTNRNISWARIYTKNPQTALIFT